MLTPFLSDARFSGSQEEKRDSTTVSFLLSCAIAILMESWSLAGRRPGSLKALSLQVMSQKGHLHISGTVALKFQVCPVASGLLCGSDTNMLLSFSAVGKISLASTYSNWNFLHTSFASLSNQPPGSFSLSLDMNPMLDTEF